MQNYLNNKNTLGLSLSLGVILVSGVLGSTNSIAEEIKAEDNSKKVVIVGSRIKQENLESPSPIMVIESDALIETGYTNLEEALAEFPQMGIGTNLGNGGNSGTGSGTTYANLRSLGSNRTLVLINGKRRVSSSLTSSSVDLSTIPIAIVEKVEFLTGGASAVYGSDAIAGVVNITLKSDYEGFNFRLGTTTPEKSGGETQTFSLTMGGSFAEGKGNVAAGINYTNTEPLLQKDRDFTSGKNFLSTVSNPDSTTSTDGIPDVLIVNDLVTATYPTTGGLRTWNWDESRYDNYYIDETTGELTFNDRTFYGQYTVGGPGFRFSEYAWPLRSQQEVVNLFINMNYELTNNVNFFTNVNMSTSYTEGFGQVAYTEDPMVVHRDNPTLPQSVRDFMDAKSWNQIIADSSQSRYDYVYRTHEEFGRIGNKNERDLFSIDLGFDGYIGDWDWNVSFQHGESRALNKGLNRVYKDRYNFAFDAASDADGNTVCRATIEGDPAYDPRAAGCLPLAIYGVNTNQAALDWVKAQTLNSQFNKQTLISAYTSNSSLFELPGGNAGFVIGAEYRKDTIGFTPDTAQNNLNIILESQTSPIPSASLDVTEYYTELSLPFFEPLEMKVAYRSSEYSTVGTVDAWSSGITYQPIEDLRFRVTGSSSVRAPSVYELFNPGFIGSVFITDPCAKPGEGDNPEARTANCQAAGIPDGWEDPRSTSTRDYISGGNPNLKAEEADTFTAGIVFTPTFISNLNISADWWRIELINQISTVSINQLLLNCYDTPGLTGSACESITRTGGGAITQVKGGQINIASNDLQGIDFEVAYSFNAADLFADIPGKFSTRLLLTRLQKSESIADPTKPDEKIIYKGSYPQPELRANWSFGYTSDNWGAKLIANLRGKSVADPDFKHELANYDEVYPNKNGEVGMLYRFDMSGYYSITDSTTIGFGIRNLLDKEPPRKTGLFGGNYGISDVFGRTYNLNISMDL
ncbi:TonB-dependent receptor domain-containing protein [Aliikangiella sp. IMCC44359]|uniref:TonB-dependent receptor domain-containing protein n=1 Tax=Aliikangiella sp. IMCC44359 TaxID=3459125 RepID=UPI00403AAFC5